MVITTVGVNSCVPSAAPTDPRQEAAQLAQELQALLSNPQGNEAAITKLEQQLRGLITNNPGVFSDLERTDALNFCDDIEDYYMVPGGDEQTLGAAAGWLQELATDLSQGMIPVVPAIPREIDIDLLNMLADMSATDPNINDLRNYLTDLENCDPKNLPAGLEDKIQEVEKAVAKFIANPNSDYDKGLAIAVTQSAYYALWIMSPHS